MLQARTRVLWRRLSRPVQASSGGGAVLPVRGAAGVRGCGRRWQPPAALPLCPARVGRPLSTAVESRTDSGSAVDDVDKPDELSRSSGLRRAFTTEDRVSKDGDSASVRSGSDDGAAEDTGTRVMLSRMLGLARPEAARFAFVLSSMVGTTGVSLVFPAAIGGILDSAVSGTAAYTPWEIAGGLMALFGAQAALMVVRTSILRISGERIAARLRTDLFGSIMKQDVAWFDKHRTGDVINRLSLDVSVVQKALTDNLATGLRNFFVGAGGIGMLVYLSPTLSGAALVSIPVLALGAKHFGGIIRRRQEQVQEALGETSNVAEERIAAIRTVRVFAQEGSEVNRYAEAVRSAFSRAREVSIAAATLDGTVHLGANTGLVMVLGYGGTLVLEGTMTVGGLTSFLMYCTYVGFSLASLSQVVADMLKGAGAAKRVFKVIDHEPLIPLEDGKALAEVDGTVRFDNVHFSYPSRPDLPILRGFDLDIPAGSVVALVGGSGSGKSTVATLLNRLYDIDDGAISVDGHDIRELNASWLRRQIGTVQQDPVLFSTDIMSNIRYGADSASDEQVIEAAKASNAHSFIRSFPKGYDTMIGERGVQLSGGQRQRVSIARAIVSDPQILVFDESTSALDSESEHAVQEEIDRLINESSKTVIIIAHRLSSIKGADKVCVLQDGKVVESGTYEELVARNGAFKELVQHQLMR